MGLEEEARGAARRADAAPALEWLARAGFAAIGTIHILLGILVIAVASGAPADSSESGALKAIAGAPAGFIVLWVLAITLCCLAVREVLDGVLERGDLEHRWRRRISEWSRALVYLVLGGVAAAVALGSRPNPQRSGQDISRSLLAMPGGVYLLAAIGVGIGAAGIAFAVIGIRRGFRKKLVLPAGAPGRLVVVLGAVGYLAKGVALVIVGVIVVVAAVRFDPAAVGGLDAAMSALLAVPFGHVLTSAVGVGFVVYGVFCVLRSWFARL